MDQNNTISRKNPKRYENSTKNKEKLKIRTPETGKNRKGAIAESKKVVKPMKMAKFEKTRKKKKK